MTDSTGFPASRAAGLQRLDAFLPVAGRAYATGRNADLGPLRRDHVSVLSPYLRHRLITEQEVVAAVLGRHAASAAEKFIQEVCWRTYWKGWLELRPAIWTRFRAERDALAGSGDADLAAAEAGSTGIEGFDDWARELVATGYLHNHARMWFASIWIFTLRLPWVLGADFFLRHLVDADPASNTLSWRWVAGLQTPGKTYLATQDNIARYTGGRFRPAGLARRADALRDDKPVPAARPLPPLPADGAAGPALLLITGEDMHPESLPIGAARIAGVLAAQGGGAGQTWPWGSKAAAFAGTAAEDAASRAGRHFGCPVQIAATIDPGAIVAAAEAARARFVMTAYAPVGPVADALDLLAPHLAAAGLTLVTTRRAWDEMLWPHARRGFFAFREHIPELLGSLTPASSEP